jgi:GNAT superfamily N-acetyltransferase
MVVIEPITVENIQAFKAVRLRALREDPAAFGSTYEREAAFSDEEWLTRAMRWNGELGIGFLATEDGSLCGIAGALLEPLDPPQARLVSMWTAPGFRQRGAGRLLVETVMAWARGRGVHRLLLTVVCNNQGAIDFYGRLGFAMTGRTEPYPNDPALFEFEMALTI